MNSHTSRDPSLLEWLLDRTVSPHIVMDWLSEVADHNLAKALNADSEGLDQVMESASGTLVGTLKAKSPYGSYWHRGQVEARLVTTGGIKSLEVKCPICHPQSSCSHALKMLISVICGSRPDVAALLSNQQELQRRTLSTEAAAFLGKAATLSVAPLPTEVPIQPDRRLIYRLVPDVRGYFSKLTVQIGTKRKSGGYSSRAQQLDWSDMLQLTQAQSGSHFSNIRAHGIPSARYENDGLQLSGVATSEDKQLAKKMFMQVGLPPVTDLQITNLDLLDSMKVLCQEGRLFLADDVSRPLVYGANKIGQLSWKRSSSGNWCLSLVSENGIGIAPTDPPIYVNHTTGEIGRVEANLTHREMELLAMARSLTDRDIEVLRGHPRAGEWLANLPELPEVIVEYMGMATPRMVVHLQWTFDADVLGRLSITKRRSDMGRATASLRFDYEGLRLRDETTDELVRMDGDKTLVYTRDLQTERDAIYLVSEDATLDEMPDGFLVHHGSQKATSTRAKIQAYQQEVVSEMFRRGWQVRMDENWPLRKVDLETLQFTSTELGEGWFGFDLSTHIHGARIDMLALLKDALTDRGLLASIARADEKAHFKVMSPEGYEISVPVSRLKRLLPFFLTITTDAATGKAKLRRIEFGVLEEARSSENSVVDGGAGLLEISKQLSDFSPELPQHTIESMAEPAREYQAYGATWTDARRKYSFGAIIGDEYAVGKTLQTAISVFNAAHEPGLEHSCCLIVVTKTLFFAGRWQEDMQRFLPTMRFAEVYGNKHIGRLVSLDGVHAVLTTYDTVIDNLDAFQPIPWNLVACDEGHKVNNSVTLAHKAIAALQARQKLVVTGSPMQNGAREIWALMNLVAPGLLKDRVWFNQTFPKAKLLDGDLNPLETQDEAQLANVARLNALGKIISPFFLRRTNSDLGRQLPPVQVIERHIVMEQDQADVYEAIRAAGKREALAAVEAKGLNLSRLDVLTQINRLRQVCCDPSIVSMQGKRDLQASSAKREAIMEICQELVADNRKIVITSEWNRLLDNIDLDLKTAGIETVVMTGKLTGHRRLLAQEEFRKGAASVMLIQLTIAEGIELPEGDAIIICEPWWNRKKEEQAIARLRRDERDKHINVIRLIVQGSVEMGVIRVAQGKLDDIEAVQMGHSAATGGLSMDDIEEFFKPLGKPALAND